MIYGVGTDIVDIARIEAAVTRSHGERFVRKILGGQEYEQYCLRNQQSSAKALRYLATRFAAKEAFSKAIGTGVRLPMTLRNLQTLNEANGRPYLYMDGDLQAWMQQKNLSAHVSISDEAHYVIAFVIVESCQ